jgi:hypothetical protein
MSKLKAYTVPLTIDQGSSSDSATLVPVTGYLKGIAVTAGAMDGSDTYTVAITDKYGITVFSRGSLAESSTTTIWADKYNELGTTKVEGALLNTPMSGPCTVTITASATQDDADVDYIVYIYFE